MGLIFRIWLVSCEVQFSMNFDWQKVGPKNQKNQKRSSAETAGVKRGKPSRGQGGPPLNVGVNLPPPSVHARAGRETLFFSVVFVFVFVMVLHGFLDQFKCHKLSSRVGAVHVFMKLTDLEKYENCTYICTGFRSKKGRPFLMVFDTFVF